MVSLFAGIGGFDLAAERAGITTTSTVELDTAARGVLHDHYPHTRHLTDISEVTADDLRNTGFDPATGILTGGWPCQDVSIAGARRGMGAGTRSGLWWQMRRLMADLRPTWVVGENVPGALSSNAGADWESVITSMVDLGYGVCWRILDAQGFGVPQRRRRLFIVGRLGSGAGAAEVLLDPEGGRGDPAARGPAESASITGHGSADPGTTRSVARPLTAAVKGQRLDWSTETFVADGTDIRRLTPTECERLQGFPDGWTATSNHKPQADAARYRQLGNAVAVPVVEWILRRVVAHG